MKQEFTIQFGCHRLSGEYNCDGDRWYWDAFYYCDEGNSVVETKVSSGAGYDTKDEVIKSIWGHFYGRLSDQEKVRFNAQNK